LLASLQLPLQSGALTIRSWEDADAPAYFELAHDPAIIQYISAPPKFADTTQDVLRSFIAATSKGELYRLAICGGDGVLVGFISLQNMKRGDPRLELVLAIGSEYRGRGYGQIAARGLVAATFGANSHVTEIYGRREFGNSASRGLMRSLGMRTAGLEPSTKPDAECPDRLYVISRSAWRDV
jgi:[ribosomal protein S5]-alanine N-acetyltransferase